MCGGVRFEVTGTLRDVWNCHCHRCRQFTGHYLPATATLDGRVIFAADETLTWYEPADGVFYGFCGVCGSSLFWRTADSADHLSIAAGSLDQPTGLTTAKSWWTAEKADYHVQQAGLVEYDYES